MYLGGGGGPRSGFANGPYESEGASLSEIAWDSINGVQKPSSTPDSCGNYELPRGKNADNVGTRPNLLTIASHMYGDQAMKLPQMAMWQRSRPPLMLAQGERTCLLT